MNQLILNLVKRFGGTLIALIPAEYRPYIAGVSFILGAVVSVLNMIVSGAYSENEVAAAIAAAGVGIKMFRDAGKKDELQKLVDELKAKVEAKEKTDGVG